MTIHEISQALNDLRDIKTIRPVIQPGHNHIHITLIKEGINHLANLHIKTSLSELPRLQQGTEFVKQRDITQLRTPHIIPLRN